MFVEETLLRFSTVPDGQARAGAHKAVTVMSVFLNGGRTAPDLPGITVLLFRLHPGHEEFPLKATEIPELGIQGSDTVSGGFTK